MPNTSYQTNPLLVTPATPLVVPTPAVVSGDTPGAMQMTTGAQASMVPPTVTPVVPGTTPEPTVGQTLGTINSTAASNANPTINEQVAAANAPKVYSPVTLGTNNIQDPRLNPIDEKAITRNQMKLFQAEIDATNKVYDQLYNQKVLEGTGRLGTQRAQAARGGLLGSDFGTAQQEKVMSYNTAEQQAVQAERQAKIGAIMGKVRTAVADEIAAKRLARTQDADAYLKYLNGRDETRQKNTQIIAESFLSQGIDPTTLTPDEMKAITGDSGISAADIIMSYQSAKSAQAEAALKGVKTQAEIDKLNADTKNAGYFNLSEGQSRYDANGNVIASKAKTYAPGTTGLKIGGKALDSQAVSDVHQQLQSKRGSDGYTDTGYYMQELDGFVKLGGDPKDFIKEYAPDVYINPSDPTRSFLEAYMKKQSTDSNFFLGSIPGVDINAAISDAANQ